MAKIITSVISKDEFISEIDRLHGIYDKINGLFETLYDTVGGCDRLIDTMFDGFDEAVRQLELRVNEDDDSHGGWGDVDWFIHDNDWGSKGYTIGVNGKDYAIYTAEDLWRAIKKQQE